MSYKLIALGDICTITGGGTPSKSNPSFYEGDIYWATVRDMSNDVLSETDFKISIEAVKESSTNIIPKGNVVIATRVGLGKVCILNQDTAINQDLRGVTPKNVNQLDVKYLFYWFKSISQKIIDAGRGATVHGVTLPFIKSLEIPLPSLATQQKIVAKLDAVFAEIDKAVLATEANVKNAESLFKSYLFEVFEQGGSEWIDKKLTDVAIYMGRGKSKHRPRNDASLYGGEYPFIQTGDVRNCDKFITNYTQTYNEKGLAQSKLWKANTVCITIAANIAEIGILGFDACFPDSVIGVVVDKEKVSEDFLYLMLLFAQQRIKDKSKGSAQENINLATFEDMLFKVAPLNQQKIIIEKFNNLKISTDFVHESNLKKMNELLNLKNSILKQAFNGELVKD